MTDSEPVPQNPEPRDGFNIVRRARKKLALIEARCAYMHRESQRAIEAYVLGDGVEFPRGVSLDHPPELKRAVRAAGQLSLRDLGRFTRYWEGLVPGDPDVRAALIHLFEQRYGLVAGADPGIATALGMMDPAVQDSYRHLYGESLDTLREARPAREPKASEEPDSTAPGTIDAAALREAAAALEWLALPGGSRLYAAGDVDDGLYIVASGRLRMTRKAEDGSEQTLGELGRGEIAGLTEAVTGEPRAHDVIVLRDSEVVKLPAEMLRRLAAREPQVAARVNRTMAQHLRAQLVGLPRSRNTLGAFAIVPAGPAVPLAEFSRQFVETLGTYGSTLCLDSKAVDAQFCAGFAQAPQGGMDHGRLAAWLSEQEMKYRYVVYVTDESPSHWTERCVRQADRVLMLADADADATPGEIERSITCLDAQACTELVLLHPTNCRRPENTARWLVKRKVRRHYHLRAGVEPDLHRLVRCLTGRAVGLVLGGGGARGWAHLGVWRALVEAGVEVDLFGGTSMGALIGGALAMDQDYQQIVHHAGEFSNRKNLFDITLPLVSFFKSEKVSRMLQQVYGDVKIEDLWRPFFCVASNLTCATEVVFTEGPLWQAVRASLATPGIFAPMLVKGEVLVDGAVLNNLPCDVMDRFGDGGPIVAVNIFPDVDLVKDYAFGHSVSGWQVLARFLNPFKKSVQVPWLFENLVRVVALNGVQQARSRRDLATVYIRPEVQRFNILDFPAYKEIIELGYQAARVEIAKWLQRAAPADGGTQPESTLEQLARALAGLDMALDQRGSQGRDRVF